MLCPDRSCLTIVRVELPDGTTEWIALGSTGADRESLRAAGFSYDRKRRSWRTTNEPEVHELLSRRAVFAHSSGGELTCAA